MDASGLMASWFQSHSVVCLAASLSACFSGRLLTCTAGSCGIHRRDEGHGLTFVYFKGYMLCLNVVVLFPADLERDRDVWPDFSPSTDALWKPSLDRHGNAFSRAHYPDCGAPFCCRQCRRVQPLPHGPLSVCPGWLNTCFLKSTNMLTNQQSQVGRTAAELFRVLGRPQSLFTSLIFLHLSSRRRCSKKGMKE